MAEAELFELQTDGASYLRVEGGFRHFTWEELEAQEAA